MSLSTAENFLLKVELVFSGRMESMSHPILFAVKCENIFEFISDVMNYGFHYFFQEPDKSYIVFIPSHRISNIKLERNEQKFTDEYMKKYTRINCTRSKGYAII